MTGLGYGIAAGAGLLAGGVNALAGGGTLVSFPALQFIGLSSINANVTNIVALTPGYAAGSAAQRGDLEGQGSRLRALGVVSGVGGLLGSVLLVVVAAKTFQVVVPFLILLGCLALAVQRPLRRRLEARQADRPRKGHALLERLVVFGCSLYGGFFGAGLGIMLLAILGLFTDAPIARVNALKSLLSFFINLVAAVFFAFSGHVQWLLVPVMAAASLVGGNVGGRLARIVNGTVLRYFVVVVGAAVAISFWLT